MPPYLDAYIITPEREEETIERFLASYTDRAANEDREDEELMLLRLGVEDEPESTKQFDWEPARTLTNVVKRGLDYPRRCFAIYLCSNVMDVEQAILKFTADNQLIFGVSIDDPDGSTDNLNKAKRSLATLLSEFNGRTGIIGVELAPADTETEFEEQANEPNCLFATFH